jgi:hypothetical protein
MNFGNQPAGVPAESFHVAARVTYASLASAVVCAMQSAAVFAAVRDRIKPEMVKVQGNPWNWFYLPSLKCPFHPELEAVSWAVAMPETYSISASTWVA